MKGHQTIIVIALSCLLLLVSACEKKSVRSVSGGEDLFASQGNHEVTGHDKDLYGDPSALFEESSVAGGSDAGTVEALSAADLDDGNGGTGIVGGGQEGSYSIFPVSTRSGVSGSSGGPFVMGNSKGMSQALTTDQSAGSGFSSGTSSAHEDARKNSTHVSQGLRDVFFAYDSWRLAEKSHRILESNAQWLKAHPHARINIEGHCDERGTQAYNYVLGERRARTAKQYLSHLGVPSHQMVVVSFGKDRPVCHVLNTACFQSNRRAHFSMDMNTASRD